MKIFIEAVGGPIKIIAVFSLIIVVARLKFLYESLFVFLQNLLKFPIKKRFLFAYALCVLVTLVAWTFYMVEIGWEYAVLFCAWFLFFFSTSREVFVPLPPTEVRFQIIKWVICEFAWIFTLIFLFASLYAEKGVYINDNSGTIITNFNTCIYFSIVTFTTLGYGDFCPTPETRGIAAVEAITGFLMLGFVLATFLHFLRTLTLPLTDKASHEKTESQESSEVGKGEVGKGVEKGVGRL